jgi:ketosteroid isomerase-like protein
MKEVDIEADRKILTELHSKMLVDETTDIEEEMKYFTKDAMVIPPHGPPIKGVDALREAIKEMMKTDWDLGTPGRGVQKLEVAASGDLAYDIGRFRMVNKRPEGPVEEQGYFVTLYKKIEGEWKFVCQIWNNL